MSAIRSFRVLLMVTMAYVALAGCSETPTGVDSGMLDSGRDASDAARVDAADEVCAAPVGDHCCCDGDVVYEPVCFGHGRWLCERGTYHSGEECLWDGTTCGTPCTLPCPPDASTPDGGT